MCARARVYMCIRTSEDVQEDAQYAIVEGDEVEEELDDGADHEGRVVGAGERLLDELRECDEPVPRRAAEVGGGLVAGLHERVAGDRAPQEQHRQDVDEPHLLRPDDQLLRPHLWPAGGGLLLLQRHHDRPDGGEY